MIISMVKASIRNRKITIFLLVLAAIFGSYSYIKAPKQQAPDLSAPNVLITCIYPGASPIDVERLVTRKIEDEVTSVTGFEYSESISRDDVSVVVITLSQTADTEKAYSEVRQKMQSIQNELPDGVLPIDVNTDLTETAGIIISLSGAGYTYDELGNYAEQVKTDLSKIKGISRFDISGEQNQEVVVEIDLNLLRYYNLSIEDISNIIMAQNIEMPTGSIEGEDSKINIKVRGLFESLEEIENTVIAVSPENGSVARLKDVADIRLETSENTYKVKKDGLESVLLAGYFKDDENVVSVGREVEEEINRIKSELPTDLVFSEVSFQPRDVDNLVRQFTFNLIQGVVLVIFVVFIGMGISNALVVSTAIPLSIFISFAVMELIGIKIHQISITALIISLGMLVDNAIVVSDSIQSKIDEGEDRLVACTEGTKEVAYPVLTSTLTTIGAFLPLLVLPSTAGQYIRSIPQIIIITLTASYLTAIFVTPTLGYMLFKKTNHTNKQYKIRKKVESVLESALQKRKLVGVLVLIAIGFTGFVATRLDLQFFPKDDGNILYIDIKSEIAADMDKTEMLVDEISEFLENENEVIEYTAAIGGGLPKFYIALAPYNPSPDFGQIMMRLDLKNSPNFRGNREYADYLQKNINQIISGGTAVVKELEQGYPMGAPIVIRLSGNDIEEIQYEEKKIKDIIASTPGTTNIEDNLSPQSYEFEVRINSDKASILGITNYDVQREIRDALRGRTVSTFRKEAKEHDIVLKSKGNSKEDIENIFIKSSYTGELVPLREIAEIELTRRWTEIRKYDREINISLFSDVTKGYNAVEVQNQIEEKMKGEDFGNVRITFDGERERINENFGDIGISAVIAVLLIYGVLLFQFGSFSLPFVILVTIPLSAIGSIIGLFVLNQPLSFMALLGIVSLFGIVVNNAIVLMDYISTYVNMGNPLRESCIGAVGKRFRPIVLSTVTTVIGLTPLLFSKSELFRPMAVTLMSGLLVSTVLTLIIIPTAYYSFRIFMKKIKKI